MWHVQNGALFRGTLPQVICLCLLYLSQGCHHPQEAWELSLSSLSFNLYNESKSSPVLPSKFTSNLTTFPNSAATACGSAISCITSTPPHPPTSPLVSLLPLFPPYSPFSMVLQSASRLLVPSKLFPTIRLSCLSNLISSLLALYAQVMVTHQVYGHLRAFAHAVPTCCLEHSLHAPSRYLHGGLALIIKDPAHISPRQRSLSDFSTWSQWVILQLLSICKPLKIFSQHLPLSEIIKKDID